MRASQSRFYDLRGLRLHLRQWLAAPSKTPNSKPKFIIHGWNDTSATWQRLVDHLPPQWNIHAPDARGFGLSGRFGDTYLFADYLADLDGLLDRVRDDLGIEQIDLIGHSMGGQIAALYAGLRPDRIRKLVILDALLLPVTPPEKAPERMRNWLDDLRNPAPPEKEYASVEELAERVRRYHPGLDENGALQVAKAWSGPTKNGIALLADPRHRQRGPLLYRDEEALAIFAQIQAQTLVLDADKSNLHKMCPVEVRDKRIAAIPNARREVIQDCGHMMHFDAPQKTATVIQEFLG